MLEERLKELLPHAGLYGITMFPAPGQPLVVAMEACLNVCFDRRELANKTDEEIMELIGVRWICQLTQMIKGIQVAHAARKEEDPVPVIVERGK